MMGNTNKIDIVLYDFLILQYPFKNCGYYFEKWYN